MCKSLSTDLWKNFFISPRTGELWFLAYINIPTQQQKLNGRIDHNNKQSLVEGTDYGNWEGFACAEIMDMT